MFNVNFYGRMAAAEREGEISATKSGFITKAAGHCRFMAGWGHSAGASASRPSASLCRCRAVVYHSSFTFQSAHAQSAATAAAATTANIT